MQIAEELLCEPLLTARVGQEVNVPGIMGDFHHRLVTEVRQTLAQHLICPGA